MNKIQKIVDKIKLRFYKPRSWKYLVSSLRLEYVQDIQEHGNKLLLKRLDIEIEKDNFKYLLEAYRYALFLKNEVDAIFKIEDNLLYISIDTLTFEIQTSEEFFILNEIFVEGVYNFISNKPDEDYVLIDIGMNVAYASCYFAKVKNIANIISFEPFTPTFEQAQRNIALNNLESIIKINNYGLGGKSEKLSVEYTPEFKGQVGTQGVDNIRSQIENKELEEIEIKSGYQPLYDISQKFLSKRFILKIDCEGAEYDLIETIPDTILRDCDIIMMEWHEKGSKKIEDWLIKNRFSLMSFNPHSKRVGMIYAIKN